MKQIYIYLILNLLTFGIGFIFPPVWILSVLCGLIAGLEAAKEFKLC